LAFMQPKMKASAWILTYIAGVFIFVFGCLWIAETAVISLTLMAMSEGLAVLVFCWIYRNLVLHKTRPIPPWIALPLVWVAIEYLRSVWPLDGYPWLLIGYSLWHCPVLIQIADITGVFGISFMLAMAAGVAVAWIIYFEKRESAKPLKGSIVFLALLLGVTVYGVIRPKTLEVGEGPILAAVQGNIPQKLKDNRSRASEVYEQYKKMTIRLFNNPDGVTPSLVVWPETIFPYPLGEGNDDDIWWTNKDVEYKYADFRRQENLLIGQDLIQKIIGPHDAWFLTGAVGYYLGKDNKLQQRNGVFLYDSLGERKGVYYKTVLVPGGEYLPWIDMVPESIADSIKSMVLETAGFLPELWKGSGPKVFQMTAKGRTYRFGVQICYENIYGDYCRKFIKEGGDFLINISNEGWFNKSSEFDQMMAMSVFRAIEMRRTLFRSTNTGISCVIGPRGAVPGLEDRIASDGEDRAVEGILKREAPICRSGSFYVEYGDLFAKILFYMQIIVLLFLLFRRSSDKKISLSA